MPQNTPIVIKDGAATPVDHTFSPVSTQNGAARFENQGSSTTLVGREAISVVTKRPSTQKGAQRSTAMTSVQLTVPVMVDGSGSQGESESILQHTLRATAEIVVDPRATAQQRKDIRVLLANALLNASIGQAADNAENFW